MIVDFNGKDIYVEVHGNGAPVVLLNGIMMSIASWKPFIEPLSRDNKLILIDFLDQGQSHKMTEKYPVALQADVVKCVLDALKIKKSHISGVSYGAAVAMNFALKYPEYVDRLALFNCIAYSSKWMGYIGDAWKMARITPQIYYSTTTPIIYSMGFYNKKSDWLESRKDYLINNLFNKKAFLDAMERLIDSMTEHDVRDKLSSITAETLVVGSSDDNLTPIAEQKYIRDKIPGASLVIMDNCGHASMYENPTVFILLLTGFINHGTVTL